MLPFLSKPYPFNPLSRKDSLSSFLIGCFVAFFLLVFQPFGISLWETPHRFLKILGFGLVSFLCPVIFKLVLMLVIRARKPEENWNVWKEILSLIVVLLFIALGNMVYGNLIGIATLSFGQLAMAVSATFLLGLFPVTANVALKYNRFQALNQKEAQRLEQEVKGYQHRLEMQEEIPGNKNRETLEEITGDIAEEPDPKTTDLNEDEDLPDRKGLNAPDQLILVAENEKDRLEVSSEDLLYIESADNYSAVVFLSKGNISKQLIRASLKRIESQIGLPYMIRCHRSYIVNLKQISTIKGNAQGYKIEFKTASASQVPVSRNYGKLLFEKLEAMS
jgi:DNA-binding LytR/AlgR family response regulator